MRRTLLNIIAALALLLVPATALATNAAYADCNDPSSDAQEVLQGVGETGGKDPCSTKPITNVFRVAVQILGIIAGVIGIIMVMIGGFRYITSGGEASRVSNAKSTLIYALIGLAIAAIAQLLVHFVLYQTTKAVGSVEKPGVIARMASPVKLPNDSA